MKRVVESRHEVVQITWLLKNLYSHIEMYTQCVAICKNPTLSCIPYCTLIGQIKHTYSSTVTMKVVTEASQQTGLYTTVPEDANEYSNSITSEYTEL